MNKSLGQSTNVVSEGLKKLIGKIAGTNLCPLVSRVPESVRESKMTEEPETPG